MVKRLINKGLVLIFALAFHCQGNELQAVAYTDTPMIIDGKVDEAWEAGQWLPMNERILGSQPSAADFSGQFKLRWDEEYLYLLAIITDDVLSDRYPNPSEHYWDDDSLEIFLDPDGSGGDHLYSYNAYAYHVALDGNAVDIGEEEGDIILLNSHLDSHWSRSEVYDNAIVWEVRIRFYSEQWGKKGMESRTLLRAGHNFGFMLAYCDADGKGVREHFMGSQVIQPINGSKDLGYKTADVFTKMTLVK